jgi:hypothetical protein
VTHQPARRNFAAGRKNENKGQQMIQPRKSIDRADSLLREAMIYMPRDIMKRTELFLARLAVLEKFAQMVRDSNSDEVARDIEWLDAATKKAGNP